MGKFSFNLRDFIHGMKKGNYDQITEYLFGIDTKTGNLCGCALGQGILNSGLVDPEEIKKTLLSKGEVVEDIRFRPNGTGDEELRTIITSSKLEGDWMGRLTADLGGDFVDLVYSKNDDGDSMPEVIDAALAYEANPDMWHEL